MPPLRLQKEQTAQKKDSLSFQLASLISGHSSDLIIRKVRKFFGNPRNLVNKVRNYSKSGLQEKEELQSWAFESSFPVYNGRNSIRNCRSTFMRRNALLF